METRELRYFVAVAEELHFGRAARRLGIAQPPLSRAIRQLERRLDVTLLERTSRTVTLTEAGSVLLREGRAALDAVDAADRRTRRAATGQPGPGPRHEGRSRRRTAAETARRVRRRTRRGRRRRAAVRHRRAGTAAARRAGRRGAAAPAVRLDGRARHRGPVYGGAGRGPAGRAPPHRRGKPADGRRGRAARPADAALARPRRHVPGRPRSGGSGPAAAATSSSPSAGRARSSPSRAGPTCAATSPPCRCWTRRR